MDAATNSRLDSPPSNIVKHRGEFCRILLVSPSSLHVVEVLEGWSLQQNEQRDCWPCQPVHCILNETMDGQSILSLISLLDRIRSGWFDLICLLPAAATWSRARHYGNGQKPLRARTGPFGLQSLDPSQRGAKRRSRARQRRSLVSLVFPEDLGGWLESGPSSIWGLQELRSLEDYHGGRRGAVYLCQIGDSAHMRLWGSTRTWMNYSISFTLVGQNWPPLFSTMVHHCPIQAPCRKPAPVYRGKRHFRVPHPMVRFSHNRL